MYTSIDPNEILQGDLIKDYNFVVPPTDELQVLERTSENKFKAVPISSTTDPYSTGQVSVIANSFVSNAIIISQSCDIQRRDYIHLCPVHKLSNLRAELTSKGYELERINNTIDSLKLDKTSYYYYLPASNDDGILVEESYIDLQFVGMIPLVNMKSYTRILSLTDLGRHRLSFKLINLYGRPF